MTQPIFVGWDVSTSIVGVCILTFDGNCDWKIIDLRKAKTLSKKYKLLENGVTEVFDIVESLYGSSVQHVIEERLAGFSGGFTNKNTLLMLAAMNAVATFLIECHSNSETLRLAPISTKAIVGLKVPKGGSKKEAAVKFCHDKLGSMFPYEAKKKTKKAPHTEGHWKDGIDDLADAYLLALAASKKWK